MQPSDLIVAAIKADTADEKRGVIEYINKSVELILTGQPITEGRPGRAIADLASMTAIKDFEKKNGQHIKKLVDALKALKPVAEATKKFV